MPQSGLAPSYDLESLLELCAHGCTEKCGSFAAFAANVFAAFNSGMLAMAHHQGQKRTAKVS